MQSESRYCLYPKHFFLSSSSEFTPKKSKQQRLRRMSPKARLPGLSWFCHSLAVPFSVCNLTSLCLYFCIWKLKIVTISTSYGHYENKIKLGKVFGRAWHKVNAMTYQLKLNLHSEVLLRAQTQFLHIISSVRGDSERQLNIQSYCCIAFLCLLTSFTQLIYFPQLPITICTKLYSTNSHYHSPKHQKQTDLITDP